VQSWLRGHYAIRDDGNSMENAQQAEANAALARIQAERTIGVAETA
jgi:hypothetical protein